MSILAILKEKRVERKKLHDQNNQAIIAAAKEKRSLTKEEEQEFDRRDAACTGTRDKDGNLSGGLDQEIERLEKQLDRDRSLTEVRNDDRTAGQEDILPGTDSALATLGDEQRSQFKEFQALEARAFFIAGKAPDRVEYLPPELKHRHAVLEKAIGSQFRALSASTGASGAYSIPTGFIYTLDVATRWYGGIIQAADYIDTDNGQQLPYPSINDTSNTGEGPLAENSQVAGSAGGGSEQDPAYGVRNFNAYMFDTGFVLVPIQLLQDSAFNVDEYINSALQTRLGRKLNTKATIGSGTSDVQGVVVGSTLGVTAASASAFTYNEILGLFHSVDPSYRNGPKAGWMFNDSVLLAIKKLVDGNSRPLFIAGGTAEGIQNASPDTLHGKQYWINQDMASLATTNKTILFGDFSKYKIRRVRTVAMVRAQERFVDALQVGFLAYQRFDGGLVDAGTHPIKYLQQA